MNQPLFADDDKVFSFTLFFLYIWISWSWLLNSKCLNIEIIVYLCFPYIKLHSCSGCIIMIMNALSIEPFKEHYRVVRAGGVFTSTLHNSFTSTYIYNVSLLLDTWILKIYEAQQGVLSPHQKLHFNYRQQDLAKQSIFIMWANTNICIFMWSDDCISF